MTEQPKPPQDQGRIPWWWPLVPQVFGMLVIAYEAMFDKLDRPYVLAAGLTLAIGGKFADAIRNRGSLL